METQTAGALWGDTVNALTKAFKTVRTVDEHLGLISSAVMMEVQVEVFIPLRTQLVEATPRHTRLPVDTSHK